ncbi:MAG TPA: glycosyltransferase family 4 protein [Planctomycetaceae bacterium]|nr:glycosyltransferase family 4 protein [Planctomycetaceae bacterium]HQZ64215.1 glycosyltransferase family 4 protein [Planctomycetaceae bacterium]
MRIAHLITRLIIGGAQENTLFNVDDQHHLFGDEVCLITGPGLGPEGSLEQKARDRGLDLRVLPELHRSLNPLQDWKSLAAIRRAFADFSPELVHTHSSKGGILGRLAAHQLRLPAVHTIHGASFHYGQNPVAQFAYKFAERRAANWCQHFISVCDAMIDQYVAAGIAPREKFTTIFSGMDVDHFITPRRDPTELRQELGIAPSDIVIGKVARLFHLKGHEYLIEAAPDVVKAVPNVRFLLVGDGLLMEQCQKRIAELGLTNHFVFAGLVPPEAVGDYLHAMDVVVHTSVWEGLARVLPQALIAGKPVISFDIDGAAEVCIPNETGLLVEPRNITQLSQAMIQLAQDSDVRLRLGDRGRHRFTEQFRHENMTQRIREVYAQVLTNWPVRG